MFKLNLILKYRLIFATLKEWLVGILLPTDVGLLIPTTQCHPFGTVKNGTNA